MKLIGAILINLKNIESNVYGMPQYFRTTKTVIIVYDIAIIDNFTSNKLGV